MLAPDQTISEFALPTLDLRAIARRAVLPVAVGAAVVAAVCIAGSAGRPFIAVLTHGLRTHTGWIALGAVFEAVSIAGYIGLLSLVAGRSTARIGLRESAQITLAGAAATRLLPTAGAGGAALTLWALRRAGLRSGDAARTLLVFLVLLYSVFLSAIVIAGGVLALGLVHTAGPALLCVIPAGAALIAMILCLVLGGGQDVVSEEEGRQGSRITRTARLLGSGVRGARGLLRRGDPRLAGAVVYWLFDAGVLWATLHAFGSPVSPAVVALAYLVGQVANTLPLPGSVSGGIAAVMIAFGVPAHAALPSVLAYRAIAVWLPTPVALAALPGLRATTSRWRSEVGSATAATAAVVSSPAEPLAICS